MAQRGRRVRRAACAAVVAVSAALGGVAGLGRPGAVAAGAMSWAYVANDFYVVGPDPVAAAVASHTGVRTAPLGHVTFTAEHGSIVVTVDDVGANAGDGHVRVWVTGAAGGEDRCLPSHTPVQLDGYEPGEQVSIWVLDVSYGVDGRCTATGGTTGTLTVVP
jgi:hypothetical protein